MTRLPFLYVFPIYLDVSGFISIYLDMSSRCVKYPSVCVKELPILRNSTLLIVNIV